MACFRRISLLAGFLLLLSGEIALPADTFTATVKSDSSADAPSDTRTTDSSSASAGDGATSGDKPSETPHFWQRDPRGSFENGGRDYCCPVAVSNSFVYLSRHGFPALLDEGDGDQPQIDLINLLASGDYMGTDPENGTPPGDVLAGVQKYVQDKGYRCARLEYEGWRSVGRKEQDTVQAAQPDLAWLKEGIADPHGSVWLNVGWYVHGDGPNDWKRVGGHWVTLVGFNRAHEWLVHNPLVRGPHPASQDVIRLTALPEGTLDVGKGATQDAAGLYRISGPGLPISSSVNAAFLDSAIVLVVGS